MIELEITIQLQGGIMANTGLKPYTKQFEENIDNGAKMYVNLCSIDGKFQRCPFNVGKPFFRWGYVILSQNKSDLVVF